MKKGFTLVELLIVIAIMGILAIIVIPTIRNDILQKSLESNNVNIISAAEDWAYDNLNTISLEVESMTPDSNGYVYGRCSQTTVDNLITKGYLVGDKENKTVLQNPVTKEPMNTLVVCVRYKYKVINGSLDMNTRIMEAVIK